MGILKAVVGAIGGGLADSWLEVVEPENMSATTMFTRGVQVANNRSSNRKGTSGIISNGSVIHVGVNQMMILVDGGRVVDYSAEPGYYEVFLSSTPSMFNGELGAAVKETFSRIKFGGQPSASQQVFFLNLQEINGIRFGTANALQYFDNFYNAELFVGCHGVFSLKITDPLKFFTEFIPRNAVRFDANEQTPSMEQLSDEFLTALQASIGQMSVDGERISALPSKGMVLCKYLSGALDDEWKEKRGLEISSVAIKGISYDEESKKLINMRNQGAMLSDPSVREGYVQGSVARGLEAAGSNQNGAAAAFMGMGMGMNSAGNFMGTASANNMQQMQMQQMQQQQMMQQQAAQQAAQAAHQQAPAGSWTCSCGTSNTGKFCSDCGTPKPQPQPQAAAGWKCSCGTENTGRFCSNCGAQPPAKLNWTCPGCGTTCAGGFCSNCGTKKP